MMATQEMVTRRSEPVLDLAPLRGMQRAGALFADLREGFRLFPLACALGWLDVKMRYRGSMLGPFWLTISTAVMVGSLSLLYSRLFHMDLARYLPYLSLSLILWGYISSLLSEGATVFTSAQGLIHATRMPYSVHVLRAIVRNVLVLLHNVAVPLVVALIFHVWPRAVWQEIPALAIWGVDSLLVCLAMGVLGARFRDIPPIVGSVVQVFFFITPIIWRPELIHHAGYLLLNPFYPLLAIVREPLLGEQLGEGIWLAALAHSAALLVLGAVVFSRFRSRLAYWI